MAWKLIECLKFDELFSLCLAGAFLLAIGYVVGYWHANWSRDR